MKFKTVCASIAVTTSIATGMIFVPQSYALAQNRPTQTEQANSKASKSLEIQWFLGFIPFFKWSGNSNSSRNQNSLKPTNIDNPNRSKPISIKQASNHKEVPAPVLIPGLAALGAGLIRKHRQEQKQIEIK
ncbi:hypothetical protein I8751_15015 [Nostocaceae cyanobacterium CENA357]|uniref:PTPA-CTERM sorting domain-containing protein n=1 Tax=Atlanticothrix silvestris CENA357 TaxID=1725252 RepID=A0A8J7L618_9CYAN|nr:hypothetical protein [Atlanticothrix silvestris]MBH8553657.1 hypothetical protein [Atlanticothrix silvestris CENA357]